MGWEIWKNSSLEQNLYLHNQMHDIINQNTGSIPLKGMGEMYFKFSQELQKDKSFHTLSSTIHIHLKVWVRHF